MIIYARLRRAPDVVVCFDSVKYEHYLKNHEGPWEYKTIHQTPSLWFNLCNINESLDK